ncbi:MAG: hypothetical protein KAQ72_17270 [Desulfobacula sp.]|nr:hypothetical protein [Desulfobacula sp.]
MSIISSIDKNNDLTIFTTTENPTLDEFMTAVKSFYDDEPTRNVIFNLNQASVWDLSGQDIEKIAYFAPRFDKRRAGAKTAIVAPDRLSNTLSQLFVLFGKSKDLPIKVKLFQTTDKAMEWIIKND